MKERIERAITKAGEKFIAFMMWIAETLFTVDRIEEPRKIHYVKCESTFFEDVVNNYKPFEVRKNDRDYRAGDDMVLREWDKALQEFTGREDRVTIIYLLENYPGIEPGYCVLRIERYY